MHDGAAELAVLHRWEQHAHAFGVLPGGDRSVPDLVSCAAALVRVHRDLHDKQALIGPGAVGLLHFDLAAAGEAALDPAKLLVHLDVRGQQGLASGARGTERGARAYGPFDDVLARLPAYDLVSRRRVAAVYGFRPAHAEAAAALLT